ncbi:MAG: AAA family ATPase, partial [Pseudomonadota bacterium]|nr:AAA family ATPase [Pseudomonadota bacterium]
MRLKKIKINGFKSFLETATIDLKTNMVAIVGPNGCGKSNVIEALTWVLGETSAKQLRGGQMDDVIFNGNTTKNPIGRASVELILENAEGILGDKYSGFNEISIRRELDRNSASNYSINGVRCRRRDVADLFLGTGLGSKQQYSIIGQGMVTQLVESKPDDLRLFIEEAAGVSRYKERKRETLNKIKSVNENLGRIQDIKSEVEKQLKKLDRQAKGAESYKKLKLEEGRLKSLLNCLIWNQYDKNRSVLMKKKHVCEKEVNEQQSQLIKSETESDLVSEKIAEITESLNKTKEEFYKSDAVIAQLRNQYMANKKEHSKLLGELAEKENSEKLLKNEMNIQKKKINELELIISDAVLSYQAKHQTLRKKKEELSVLS